MQVTILVCVHSKDDMNDFFLQEALMSIKNQTYKNFKIILVLDECWEKTEIAAQKILNDMEHLILKKEKKEGLAFAKNYGLSHVDTEYVTFLDADDFYMPNKIEKQVDYLKINDVDFLGTHAYNIFNREKVLYPSCFDHLTFNTHEDIINILPSTCVLTHGSMMIKMEALKNLNYYNHVKGTEDWDLWKRAALAGYKFYQLPERLYVYSIGTSIAR